MWDSRVLPIVIHSLLKSSIEETSPKYHLSSHMIMFCDLLWAVYSLCYSQILFSSFLRVITKFLINYLAGKKTCHSTLPELISKFFYVITNSCLLKFKSASAILLKLKLLFNFSIHLNYKLP